MVYWLPFSSRKRKLATRSCYVIIFLFLQAGGGYYVPTMQQQPRSYYTQMAPTVRPRWNTPTVQPRFSTLPPGGQQVRQQVSSRPITGQPNANQPRMPAAAAQPQVRPAMPPTAQNMQRPSYKYAAAVRNNPPAAPAAQQVM